MYYEKSKKNPDAIVARGIYTVRDYRTDYKNVKTQYMEKALYVFEMGGSVMFNRYGYYSDAGTMEIYIDWYKCKSVHSLYGQYHNNAMRVVLACSSERIRKAVTGTPFRFSTWESYYYDDMVKFFDLYSRYPCIEYLTKLNFEGLVKDKLTGDRTYSAINWNGKDLFKVLRLTKQELNTIKKQNIYVTFFFLKVLQISKKKKWNLSLLEVSDIAHTYEHYYFKELQEMLVYGSIKKILAYLNKQASHLNPAQTLLTWRDYIADCKKLEMDLTNESVLFPRNLYQAHQNTIKQIKIKADKALNKKIRARLKELRRKYYFEYQGLMIRPAESSNELIDEGKALNHCGGTYANSYASGDIVLLLIRKLSEPDKPYYTVEVKGQKVTQARGLKNCDPEKAVKEFVEAFKAEKLQVKKTRQQIRIPA